MNARHLMNLKKLMMEKKTMNIWKSKGFLIGFRILPDSIKDKCPWERLAIPKHGSSQAQLRIYGFILELESNSRVAIGTALKSINYVLTYYDPSPVLMQPSSVIEFHSHLKLYRDILKHANLRNDLYRAWGIHGSLRQVLETVLANLSGDDLCPAIIHTLSDLVGLLYECTGYKLRIPSMIEGLVEFLECMTCGDNQLSWINHNRISETRSVVKMVALAFSLLVRHEFTGLKHIDKEKGTILHMFFAVLQPLKDFVDLIIPVVRKFLHFGFPVGGKLEYAGLEGPTILEVAKAERDFSQYRGYDLQKFDELVELLSKEHESVLPLQELAARFVLQNRIPYRGIVPKPISKIIEGD